MKTTTALNALLGLGMTYDGAEKLMARTSNHSDDKSVVTNFNPFGDSRVELDYDGINYGYAGTIVTRNKDQIIVDLCFNECWNNRDEMVSFTLDGELVDASQTWFTWG